jgi:ferredoxin
VKINNDGPISDSTCRQEPGAFRPSIDRNRCEGKAACVTACPVQVFQIDVLPPEARVGLSFIGRIKG